MLTREISLASGGARLYVLSIPQLVRVLKENGQAAQVAELARAVQVEGVAAQIESAAETSATSCPPVDEEPVADVIFDEPAVPPIGAEPEPPNLEPAVVRQQVAADPEELGEIARRLAGLSQSVLADGSYVFGIANDKNIDLVIQDIKTHDWYTQNPAIQKLRRTINGGNPSDDQLFLAGRNLYQSACGGAWAATQILERILTYLDAFQDDAAAMICAGMFFESFFNAEGAVRSKPKDELIKWLFILGEQQRFEIPVAWLRERLGQHLGKFLRVPGDGTRPDVFTIDWDGVVPLRIRLGNTEITKAPEGPFDWRGLPSELSVSGLKRTLANHFSTLVEWIEVAPVFEGMIDLSAFALIDWGSETEVQLKAR